MSVKVELENLSLVKRIKLYLTGFVKIDPSLDHYIYRCPEHGFVITYPSGWKKKLVCPVCLKEDET